MDGDGFKQKDDTERVKRSGDDDIEHGKRSGDSLLERSRERLQRCEYKRRFEQRQNNRRSRSENDDNSEKGSRFVHLNFSKTVGGPKIKQI